MEEKNECVQATSWRFQGQEHGCVSDEAEWLELRAEGSSVDLGPGKEEEEGFSIMYPGRDWTGRWGCPMVCLFSGFCISRDHKHYNNYEINLVSNLRLPSFSLAR